VRDQDYFTLIGRCWQLSAKPSRVALRLVAQGVIHKHQGGHGLDDGHGARQDAGIMPASALQRGVLELEMKFDE
jgi:hypothetical protein